MKSLINPDENSHQENHVNGTDKINMPSFVRLFTIKRIFDGFNYISNKTLSERKKNKFMSDLANSVTEAFKDNQQTATQAQKILQRLINDGINQYMSKWYNEKKDAIIIETIFNKIILIKFEKEYTACVTYKNCTNVNVDYQISVFNTNDLMCNIFQYLEYGYQFNGDLFNCSLVCSYWLYHVWNPNSIYSINLTKLIKQTSKFYQINDDHVTPTTLRMWQRFFNAKIVSFDIFYGVYSSRSGFELISNKLSMFGNIEQISGNCNEQHVSMIQPMLKKCQDRLKRYDFCHFCLHENGNINNNNNNRLEPMQLKLINAQYINIYQPCCFYISWSKRCYELLLSKIEFANISNGKDWLDYVIKNCDCSRINSLHVDNVSFWVGSGNNDDNDNNNTNNSQNNANSKLQYKSLLKDFALKFENLQHLRLRFVNNIKSENLLLWFCKMLCNNIVSKNESTYTVELELELSHRYLQGSNIKQLNQFINSDESRLKITKIDVCTEYNSESHDSTNYTYYYESIAQIICKQLQSKNLQSLKIGANGFVGEMFSSIAKNISPKKSLSSGSIDIIHLYGQTNLKDVNEFFVNSSILTDDIDDDVVTNKPCIVVETDVFCTQIGKEQFMLDYQQLCGTINQLLLQMVAIKIKINVLGFNHIQNEKELVDQCKQLILKHFDKQLLKTAYKNVDHEQMCNTNICLPLEVPEIMFEKPEAKWGEQYKYELRVANVMLLTQ